MQAPTLHFHGNPDILTQPTLALLCSAQAPAGVLLAVHDLAQRWRHHGPVIMSGFQSPVEEEALTVLLRGPRPVAFWLARGPYRRVPEHLRPALDDGRLLIVAPFPPTIKRPTQAMALQRNRLLCAQADGVLVAHAAPGSGTATLAQDVLEWGKPVFVVDHPANGWLVRTGARPYALQTVPSHTTM